MRKICLVTTTRAEYGIMSRLIEKLNDDEEIEFQLIASGMHLSEKFGSTVDEIKVPITKKIDIEIEKEPAHALALAVEKFTKAIEDLTPDIVVLLGDRYEIMGAAQAAMLCNVPIAHLHGGETTEGAIDEAIRHSVTKMSHLHFTSCEDYRKRVIQLGEEPKRVFNVGSLGVENIKKLPLLSKEELEKSLDFQFGKKNLLVTFHPVTLEKGNAKKQFEELLTALDLLENTNIIFTMPNSDSESDEIFKLINEYVKSHKNSKAFKSLGVIRYLSALQFVDAVVGNSSSGIVEVPSFNIATVNIGNRQKGRIQASSIINCNPEKDDILKAVKKVYTLYFENVKNPYEGINTADRIIDILKNHNLENILKKKFYDIKQEF